ncbi:MAG: hypothetical protein ACXABF_16245 [Candidatus Thorarchaeota archaeon]
MHLNWKSLKLRGGLLVIAVLLFLSPAIGSSIYYSLTPPPTPPMGQADVAILEDTFVTTLDNLDHSSESLIRVSNLSNSESDIEEIAYLSFEFTIPPGGSYLANLTLDLHIAEVVSGGKISLHKVLQESLGTNISYDNRPSFDPEPFNSVTISQNGTYTIQLYTEGGYLEWLDTRPEILLAITVERGTEINIHSSEADPALSPLITLYTPFGLWINPAEHPELWYILPFGMIPVIAAFVLLCIVSWKSVPSSQVEVEMALGARFELASA